jgi:hypothetical protein
MSVGAQNLACALASFALFSNLSQARLSELGNCARCATLQAGERVWFKGAPARHVTLVESGLVVIQQTTVVRNNGIKRIAHHEVAISISRTGHAEP